MVSSAHHATLGQVGGPIVVCSKNISRKQSEDRVRGMQLKGRLQLTPAVEPNSLQLKVDGIGLVATSGLAMPLEDRRKKGTKRREFERKKNRQASLCCH